MIFYPSSWKKGQGEYYQNDLALTMKSTSNLTFTFYLGLSTDYHRQNSRLKKNGRMIILKKGL
jgi:hypothetical protein